MGNKTVAIVIVTYNRRDDLARTCSHLRKLDPAPDEIIICLDGCTDGSREMFREDFPEFRVIENETCKGSIPSRDRAFRLVHSDLVVSLDDDSYPLDTAFVAKVAEVADAHPEAGAFTFPEIWNDGSSPDPDLTPRSHGHYVRDFPNCAGMIRRAIYGDCAQYPLFFRHMHEEPDFCLQLYGAGYAVWFEPSLHIRHHFTLVQRNMVKRHMLNARNEMWSALMRCPFPYVLAIAPFRALRQLMFAFRQGWSWWSRQPIWWWHAIQGIPQCLRNRAPIRWATYFNWLKLGRKQITRRDELEEMFGWSATPASGEPTARSSKTSYSHG